jgi:hypothetical protein
MLALNRLLLNMGDWKPVKITLQPTVCRPVSCTPDVDFASLCNEILDSTMTCAHRGCFADAAERSSMDRPRRNTPQAPPPRAVRPHVPFQPSCSHKCCYWQPAWASLCKGKATKRKAERGKSKAVSFIFSVANFCRCLVYSEVSVHGSMVSGLCNLHAIFVSVLM